MTNIKLINLKLFILFNFYKVKLLLIFIFKFFTLLWLNNFSLLI